MGVENQRCISGSGPNVKMCVTYDSYGALRCLEGITQQLCAAWERQWLIWEQIWDPNCIKADSWVSEDALREIQFLDHKKNLKSPQFGDSLSNHVRNNNHCNNNSNNKKTTTFKPFFYINGKVHSLVLFGFGLCWVYGLIKGLSFLSLCVWVACTHTWANFITQKCN